MRRKLLLLITLVLAMTVTLSPADPAAAPSACDGFRWGGQCWSPDEGREFVGWLNRHGASAVEFKQRHPELASMFKQPWPPKKIQQAWQTCQNGYECAKAITQHYFGAGWGYAMRIIGCETGNTFSKYVVGNAGEVSWWQLHPVHFGWVDRERAIADPRYATRMAIRLGAGRDWSPWTCASLI